jgi:hypothetical protein
MLHIPVHFPIGVRRHAVARATSLKVVTCENCREPYAFLIDIEAQGSAVDFLFLDSARSAQRAMAQAQENLAAKTRNSIATIPCPSCGSYQSDMVRQLKDNAWTNPTQIIGAIIILLSFVFLAFDIEYAALVTAAVATIGVVVLAYGYVISAQYDPNAGDPAARKGIAQQNALWGERLAKALKENAPQT